MNQTNVVEQLTAEKNQLAKHAVHVHKFGGSSLASAQCIERVADIIRKNCQLNDVVVVSANGTTTNLLFAIYDQAIQKSDALLGSIEQLKHDQAQLISSLLNASNAVRLTDSLSDDIKTIKQWLTTQPAHNPSQNDSPDKPQQAVYLQKTLRAF